LEQDAERSTENFLLDDVVACADPEAVGDAYDRHCSARPADPICVGSYQQFAEGELPSCKSAAQGFVFSERCLLRGEFWLLRFTPGLVVLSSRLVRQSSDVTAAEAEQILWTSADSGFPVSTLEEAILATDDDQFEFLELLDVGSRRTIVAITAHYGDTRVGRILFRGTRTLVARVEDSFLSDCGIERLAQGSPCLESCPGELTCLGSLAGSSDGAESSGFGLCVDASLPVEHGLPCTTHADCDASLGLACLSAGGDAPEDGECRPAWLRRTFEGPVGTLTTGGTTRIPIVASGLAPLVSEVRIEVLVGQDAPHALEIVLESPSGATSIVWDGADVAPMTDVWIPEERLTFPPDQVANGTWFLVVQGLDDDASGSVARWALTLESRFD
jgi:hypothetical protein